MALIPSTVYTKHCWDWHFLAGFTKLSYLELIFGINSTLWESWINRTIANEVLIQQNVMCPEQPLLKYTNGITRVFTVIYRCKPTLVCYLWGKKKKPSVIFIQHIVWNSLYLYWTIALSQRCCHRLPRPQNPALLKRIPLQCHSVFTSWKTDHKILSISS